MIEAVDIFKGFYGKEILCGFNATIKKSCITAVAGDSGKGKTTLLNILSLMEKPDSGMIKIDNVENPSPRQAMHLRRHTISYLFQNYGLIDNCTVEKNLKISLAYQKRRHPIMSLPEALEKVGLVGYEKRKVYELSGGEQQRVALARVLLKEASYVFADEPTGNLDVGNRDIVMKLLRELADGGKGVVLATHDLELLKHADQTIHL